MKRSAALIPLSRDHHRALEIALRLRRASPADASEVASAFREFFAEHGEHHFAIEERDLPEALRDDPEWDALIERMCREHEAIRAAAADLRPDAAALRRLGEQLSDHVRFEERRLFVYVEERLDESALAALGAALAA